MQPKFGTLFFYYVINIVTKFKNLGIPTFKAYKNHIRIGKKVEKSCLFVNLKIIIESNKRASF